jgi:prevent-host-death family protein
MAITSLADAKSRLSELVQSAETTHERTIITKNGRPAAVLLSVDDMESIEETMFWLPYLDEIRVAEQEPIEEFTKDEILEMIRNRRERGVE